MIDYLFSMQPVWFFGVVFVITTLINRRMPRFCFLLWSLVLIKFLCPFGLMRLPIPYNPEMTPTVTIGSPLYEKNATSDFHLSALPREALNPKLLPPSAPPRNPVTDAGVVAPPHRNKTVSRTVSKEQIVRYFFIAWFSLSLIVICWRLRSYVKLRLAMRNWQEIGYGPLYELFVSCVKRFHMSATPKLYLVERDYPSPFSFGFLKRSLAVAVPQHYVTENDAATLEIIFCHELAHIKQESKLLHMIRTVCISLFHIHPLRVIADFYVHQYKEICCDLEAIRVLNIPGIKYVKAMTGIYLAGAERLKGNPFSYAFLDSSHMFVKRVVYLKKFTKRYGAIPVPGLKEYVGVALFGLLFFCNITLFASLHIDSIIYISSENTVFAFPHPVQRHETPIRHLPNSILKHHQDRLWVMDPISGVYCYQLEDKVEPKFVSSYSNQIEGLEEGLVRVNDLAFYGDYLFLAVADADEVFFNYGRVEILQITDPQNIVKVGILSHNHPRLLRIIDDVLWIGGSGDTFFNGSIELHSIHTPASPRFLHSTLLPYYPADIQWSAVNAKMLALVGNRMIAYEDFHSLVKQAEYEFSATLIQLAVLEDGALVLTGLRDVENSDWNSSLGARGEFVLIRVTLNADNIYNHTVISTIRTDIFDMAYAVNSVYPLNNSIQNLILLPILPMGAAVLQPTMNGFTLLSYWEHFCMSGVRVGDFMILLNDGFSIFKVTDFQSLDNGILGWESL
ncbi:MAG: hypothetical protein C4527_27980 [Candidatus Omnitrophota bacterium]|jgi:beta-lactamase regulating signal transducer with metallopeptidase domain|nr:MAG: hypothetical protein C4527_27980 [Candidatus Omnitrophota bacterium]